MEASARRGACAWSSLSLLLLLLAPGAGLAAGKAPAEDVEVAAQAFTLRDLRKADLPGKPAPALPSERLGIDLSMVAEVMLPGVDAAQLLREDEEQGRLGGGKALRIGVGRDIAVGAAVGVAVGASTGSVRTVGTALAGEGADGHWFDLAGGARLWAIEVGSAGALGLRLHFRDVRLPAGAELAVYSPADLPALGRRQGGSTAGAGRVEIHRSGGRDDFWTATLAGERVRIEYYLPAGKGGTARELPFAVDRLQHVYHDPVAGVVAGLKGKEAGPCHNDVSCFPEWANTARSVAAIAFISNDFLYCTGQLLNSQKPDLTPYWLTANHCLSTAETAAASEIFWLYQTATCGGPPPALTSLPRSLGTSLLSTHHTSDYSLLMIDGTVPPGMTWAGWNSTKIKDGTPAVAIHHPQGDFKRISFGSKGASDACANPNLVRINWSDAPTEPGSSGSGIFTGDAKQQLFGQLFFGPSACGNETFDCYGAFSSTFPRIRNFLRQGGGDDRFEQNDTCKKARGVKTGTSASRIAKMFDPDWYQLKVPRGKTLTVTVHFHHHSGDLDARLYTSCAAEPLAVSASQENSETLTFTNDGRRPVSVFWQVYLADDVRAVYDMAVALQ